MADSAISCSEPRVVLSSIPVAVPDPWYTTTQNTALTVTSGDTPLVANDWDSEGDNLAATVVSSPAHGALSNFQRDGTITYTPTVEFTRIDTFSYQVNDGTSDSNVVAAAIAVGGHFGPRTNQDQVSRPRQHRAARAARIDACL